MSRPIESDQRTRALLLYASGVSREEIAVMLGVDVDRVKAWTKNRRRPQGM